MNVSAWHSRRVRRESDIHYFRSPFSALPRAVRVLEREFIVITCRFRNHFAPISRPSSRTLSVRATETRRIISPSDGQSRLTRVHRFHWQSCFNGNRLYRVFVPIFSTRLSINPTNYGTIKVPSDDNDFSRIRFQIFLTSFYIISYYYFLFLYYQLTS